VLLPAQSPTVASPRPNVTQVNCSRRSASTMYGKSRQGLLDTLLDNRISQQLPIEFFSSPQVVLGSIDNSPLLAPKLPSTELGVISSLVIGGSSCKSLYLYSSFGTQGGTGLATIPAVPTAKIISSSVVLDPTATLITPSTPILLKRASILRTEGKRSDLDRARGRWTSRRSARYSCACFFTHYSRILTNVFLSS
jgi:hypothetical protein